MWFFNQKRADQVAQSISQLIHTLSDGRKNHGPTSPERLLREFATLLSEDTIIGQRVVKLLMATTTKAKFLVSLATAPDHSSHRLTFDGRGVYSRFSLACFLPPRTVLILFHPAASGHAPRPLFAARQAKPILGAVRHFPSDTSNDRRARRRRRR